MHSKYKSFLGEKYSLGQPYFQLALEVPLGIKRSFLIKRDLYNPIKQNPYENN